MRFLSPIIDKLQAAFPPNRLMLILAAPIVYFSAWCSAVVSTNVPGVELPTGLVSGIVGAVVLIAVTLIYKWFDQWQAGEPIDINADLEAAYDEIIAHQDVIDSLIGATRGFGDALDGLRDRIVNSTINPAELADELEAIGVALAEVLEVSAAEAQVDSSVAAVAAPPTAPAVD